MSDFSKPGPGGPPLGLLGRLLPRGRFFRHVAVLAGGAALGQGLVLLASPLIARLYAPAEFGLVSVYGSILAVLIIVLSFRYELAIPLPEDDGEAANLMGLALALILSSGLAVALGVWAFGPSLAEALRMPALAPLLWWLPVGLWGAGAYQILSTWAVREKAFPAIARTRLNQSIGSVTTQLTMGWLGAGPLGLVLGQTVSQASGLLSLGRRAWRVASSISFRGMGRAAYRYRRFLLIAGPSSLFNVVALQLPPLLFGFCFGPLVAGLYAFGKRVVEAPMGLVGGALSQVFLSEAVGLSREAPERLARFFDRVALRLLLVGLVPAAAVAVWGGELFSLVFGAPWRVAGEYLQMMAPLLLVKFIVTPLAQTAIVLERLDAQFYWDVARAAIVAGVFATAYGLHLEAWLTIALYSGLMLLAYGWYFLWLRAYLRNRHCAELSY